MERPEQPQQPPEQPQQPPEQPQPTGPAPEAYIKAWMAEQGRKGGLSRSAAKIAATRKNIKAAQRSQFAKPGAQRKTSSGVSRRVVVRVPGEYRIAYVKKTGEITITRARKGGGR